MLAELIGDASFRIAPLTDVDADELVHGGKAGRLVAGSAAPPPADAAALVDLVHRLARSARTCPRSRSSTSTRCSRSPTAASPSTRGCVSGGRARRRGRRPGRTGPVPEEAPLERKDNGLAPAGPGWFVVNVADAEWITHDVFGAGTVFESNEAHFDQLGINVQVLHPGQPNCLYHGESDQEAILVLHGECLLLVEGEERAAEAMGLRAPGAVDGARHGRRGRRALRRPDGRRAQRGRADPLPHAEVAQRHDAAAKEETPNPREAYADYERPRPGRPEGWESLPWAR